MTVVCLFGCVVCVCSSYVVKRGWPIVDFSNAFIITLIKVYYTIKLLIVAFIRDSNTAAVKELILNVHCSSTSALNAHTAVSVCVCVVRAVLASLSEEIWMLLHMFASRLQSARRRKLWNGGFDLDRELEAVVVSQRAERFLFSLRDTNAAQRGDGEPSCSPSCPQNQTRYTFNSEHMSTRVRMCYCCTAAVIQVHHRESKLVCLFNKNILQPRVWRNRREIKHISLF